MPDQFSIDFSNRKVLVVGGSSGIGRGIARGFADQGARVTVWGTRDSAADYPAENGLTLDGLAYRQVDVSQAEQIAVAAEQLAELDTLILSQGTVQYGRKEFDAGGFRDVVALNLTSVMDCCLAFEQALSATGGSIVILGSVASFRSTKGNPAYAASKSGLLGLVRTLGEAWAAEGIRVNGVAPGLVETKLTSVTFEHDKRREGALRGIPLQRFGTPADMAGAALFLASPLAAYMTGQMLVVDGGMTLA